MTSMPHCPYLPSLAGNDFVCLFPWMKKVLKGKRTADVEDVKQKAAEALKGIKINKFKISFEQWKKVLIGVLHQMESILEVTEV